MIISLFIGIIALMGVIYLWIGQSASKNLKTNDDYFLMDRSLTFFPLSLTLLATQLGGGSLLGAAQEAYQLGWFVMFYPLGICLGLFCLGIGFGGKLRQLNLTTIAEIFEVVYRSRAMRYAASFLSIAALFFILAAQGIAARLFFVAIGIEEPLIFIAFWTILVIYTVMGGLKAVVNTDILQAVFIMAMLALAFFSVDITQVPLSNIKADTLDASLLDVPWSNWLFMPLLFMLIEQDMGQRCFAAINSRTISLAAIAAGLILLLCSIVSIYFGTKARELGIVVEDNTSVLVAAIKALTNPYVYTLFMAAIFMAVISTADSLLCAISSNFSCDFIAKTSLTEKRQMNIARFFTLITGLSSLGIAFFFKNVISLLMIAYELSVCILFVPICAAALQRKPSKIGAYLAMMSGLGGFFLFRFMETPLPKELMTVVVAFSSYQSGRIFLDKRQYTLADEGRI